MNDLLDNLGLRDVAIVRPALSRLFSGSVARFTQLVVDYDRRVGAVGVQAASQEIMQGLVQGVRAAGVENIPLDGPVLFTGNHSGLTESLAYLSLIPRADLKVIANDRPFVRALPSVFDHLIAVPAERSERFAVVRQVTRHLEAGGALYMNPAGHIEPDPACMPGAIDSLREWSPSLALFIKRVPHLKIVPVLVSGVIMASTLDHPFARLRRTQKDRERAAASIQLMIHMRERGNTPLTPAVTFGQPLLAADLVQLGEAPAMIGAITNVMAEMMQSVLQTG